ncbi:hypothetical protein GCK32_019465, partial [Trichostrongylus colubriformis]
MSKNGVAKKSKVAASSSDRKGGERARADLRKIYVNAKRIYREEEAMLALCKNCMDSIRARKEIVERIRQ